MPSRSGAHPAATVRRPSLAIIATPRSWRSSKARRKSTRTFSARSLSVNPAENSMAAQAPASTTPSDLDRIAQFNRTEMPFPNNATLQELVEATVSKHLNETAALCDHDQVFGVASLTYAQLNAKANQLAHLLRAGGVGPG